MTSNKRVGSLLTLVLTMHNYEVVSILECGHERQKSKYYSHNVPCEENIDVDSIHSASDCDEDTLSSNDDNNINSDEESIVSEEKKNSGEKNDGANNNILQCFDKCCSNYTNKKKKTGLELKGVKL